MCLQYMSVDMYVCRRAHIGCGLLGALPKSLNLVAYVISILSSDKIRVAVEAARRNVAKKIVERLGVGT